MMPTSAIMAVSIRAVVGSPLLLPLAKNPKIGIKLSRAIACRRRGAPVRLCNPAPVVDKKAPMYITHGDGHDNSATVNLSPMLSPNLSQSSGPSIVAPKNRTHVRSEELS
jgi:hypothetical protein